ncbi:MAG: hypothetical protein KF812_04080 [Fimbriimonadaceae bacterium]|nr:hypothetical protein [Fimbriimonadaceae bacterium]
MRTVLFATAVCSIFLFSCKPTIPTKDGNVTINSTGEDGGNVTINGPEGSMNIDGKDGNLTMKDDKGNEIQAGTGASDANLGVAVYPGAKKDESGGMTMKQETGSVAAFTYTTGDSVAQVSEFYKKELPSASVTTTNADGNEMHSYNLDEPKKKVMVLIMREKDKTETTISIRTEITN